MIKDIADIIKCIAQVSGAIVSITDTLGLTNKDNTVCTQQTQQPPVQYIVYQPQQLPMHNQIPVQPSLPMMTPVNTDIGIPVIPSDSGTFDEAYCVNRLKQLGYDINKKEFDI